MVFYFDHSFVNKCMFLGNFFLGNFFVLGQGGIGDVYHRLSVSKICRILCYIFGQFFWPMLGWNKRNLLSVLWLWLCSNYKIWGLCFWAKNVEFQALFLRKKNCGNHYGSGSVLIVKLWGLFLGKKCIMGSRTLGENMRVNYY